MFSFSFRVSENFWRIFAPFYFWGIFTLKMYLCNCINPVFFDTSTGFGTVPAARICWGIFIPEITLGG